MAAFFLLAMLLGALFALLELQWLDAPGWLQAWLERLFFGCWLASAM